MDQVVHSKIKKYISSKKLDKAKKLCIKEIKLNPKHILGYLMLGLAFMEERRFSLAIEHLLKAYKLDSKSVDVLNNLAACYCQLKLFSEGLSYMKQATKADPTNITLMQNLAQMYFDAGSFRMAAFTYKSIRMNGFGSISNTESIVKSLDEAGEDVEAYSEIVAALEEGEETPFLWYSKASTLNKLGRASEVKETLAILKNKYPDIINRKDLLNFARMYKNLGDFDLVSSTFSGIKVHQGTPAYIVQAYAINGELTESSINDCIGFLSKKANVLEPLQFYYIAMGIAKNYKKLKNFDKYKVWLKKANDKMISEVVNESHWSVFEEIKKSYANANVPFSDIASTQPIFIIGMPRSGTTLLESMLAGHKDIFDAGELALFFNAISKQIDVNNELVGVEHNVAYLKSLATFDKGTLNQIGEEYLKKSRHYVSPKAKYIVDKMPHNFMHAGLIHKVFPNAKIIYIRRNPISTCFSIYEQTFTMFHDYRFDESRLADYYLKFRDLMDFWKNYLPEGTMHEISYDKLVSSPLTELKNLFNYLGLDVPADVLDFHKKERVVRTASLAQVRQPLYKKKQESWEPIRDIIPNMVKKLSHLVEIE